jgi:hypothetical protein
VLAGGNPAFAVHVGVLAAQVDALSIAVCSPLAQSPATLGKLALDRGILLDPVREGILAVLDDCLAGLISIVGVAGLAWGDGGVIDKFE